MELLRKLSEDPRMVGPDFLEALFVPGLFSNCHLSTEERPRPGPQKYVEQWPKTSKQSPKDKSKCFWVLLGSRGTPCTLVHPATVFYRRTLCTFHGGTWSTRVRDRRSSRILSGCP